MFGTKSDVISTTYQKIGDLFCPVHISGLLHCVWNVPFDSYSFFGDKFEYCLSNPIQTLAHWIEYPIRKLRIFYDDLILYNFIHTSLVINSNIPCQKLYILFLYIVLSCSLDRSNTHLSIRKLRTLHFHEFINQSDCF